MKKMRGENSHEIVIFNLETYVNYLLKREVRRKYFSPLKF